MRSPLPDQSKKLERVSMNGSSFMDMPHLGKDWLEAIRSGRIDSNTSVKLHIKDFRFPAPGNHITQEQYSFDNFIHLLHHFMNCRYTLHMENMSLAYRPHGRNFFARACNFATHNVDLESVTFKSVSRDFLTKFFLVGELDYVEEAIRFKQCSIPSIPTNMCSLSLILEDIPGPDSAGHDDDSVFNILLSSKEQSIDCAECPGFNDDIITWLGEAADALNYEAEGLRHITIRDCPNFSFAALRQLISACSDPTRNENLYDGDVIEQISVYGRQSPLQDMDLEWFRTSLYATTVTMLGENNLPIYTLKSR